MLKKNFFWVIFLIFFGLQAQEIETHYKNIKIIASQDTIRIDSVSINSSFFKLLDAQKTPIDTSFYKINFAKGTLIFNEKMPLNYDTLTVQYLKFPKYLTKEYSIYDKSRVVSNSAGANLYQISDNKSTFKPFDGLNTKGSISRGITVGNNQNSVVNSALDLQITGKISDKVSLRASIQDTNIPLQSGGYSQKLDEFDQIFIELFSDKWNIRAGDLFLENRQSKFLNFNKKVQGLSTHFTFGSPENKTDLFAAAALARGQYAKSTFTGQEGNQGPYKLKGQNGELYVLVISGSERVFVNGILLKRGENQDYVIDYNAGEIIFTSLFPITSEMRINIEYQYSDRNYTRFVTQAGATHEQEKWSIGGFLYSENDVKNQPLQQSLSPEQVQNLIVAGDDINKMVAPSAFVDSFSDNKILYKKTVLNGVEFYEFSNNKDDVLYNVKFSLLGNNLGNYVLKNANAVGKIYEYKPPVNGVLQGNYEPITRLVSPNNIQIATILGKYNPSEKTVFDFEMGVSNNDKNLFSDIDDQDNVGLAGKFNLKQRLLSKKWIVNFNSNYQFVKKEFKTIERLFTIEFNRDWNLSNPSGNQTLLVAGINFDLPEKANFDYQLEKLNFSDNFSGTRHVFSGNLKLKSYNITNYGSYLQSDGSVSSSKFFRNKTQVRYNFNQNWAGATARFEDNREILKTNNQLSSLTQKFKEYGLLLGRGDSTKVYTQIGYLKRINDSLQNGLLNRVNQSDAIYLKSKLIQNAKTDLSVFINYRNLKFEDATRLNEPSLNSRILYNDRFFDQLMQVSTAYENTSGTIAQQQFTYLQVEAGLGTYRWNDYNGNGIQELEEFEIAQFKDQGKYIRVFLPNQTFLKTHQNKFSQSLTLNPNQWQNETGIKKFLSYFYNQTSYLTERKIARNGGDFDFNPFNSSGNKVLGLNSNFRNSLFYNRGKQDHSVIYTYLKSATKNLLQVGAQESTNIAHQLQYAHLYKQFWLFGMSVKTISSLSTSENYGSKNYNLFGTLFEPKISYLFSQNASLDIFYNYQRKNNKIGELELLNQQKLGFSFNFASDKKITTNGDFSFFKNDFRGNEQSPVAYQMLEGLQNGQNLTWRLLIQKKLTDFLDINVNYEGRKSETTTAIHTGNVQLRAFF